MGWAGNIISSFVSQDGKDEYLNILVAFGFGPAANVQDIFLNQKPLSSYPDLGYHFRLRDEHANHYTRLRYDR